MNANGPSPFQISEPEQALLDRLRLMWQERDPLPAGVVDRIVFALSLEDLEVELAELCEEYLIGARGEERARTVTFTSENLSVMVTLSATEADQIRVDGWITEGAGLRVELRRDTGSLELMADEDGRFAFEGLRSGFAQFVFHPTPGAATALSVPVVTPAIEL